MIQPTRVLPAQRVSTGPSSGASTNKNSPSRSTTSGSGGTSELLVAMDSSRRQTALSGNGSSGQGEGSNQNGESGSGNGPGAAGEGTAAVDTAIRTDTAGLEATRSAIDNDTAGLDAAKAALEKNLTKLAADPEKFHAVLEKSFGGTYDKAGAEKIRQQVLAGDFSWMPKIQVVDAATLQDQSGQQTGGSALGAYSRDNDTIYISRELLASDPDKAAQILTEEVGHSLDARLNTSDAAGDEGDIFSRLVGGESISDSKLAELKSENDSGTIIVDGKEVEVEYGFFSSITKPFRSIGKAIKKGFKAIKKGVSKVWSGIKKGFKKLMNSKLFNAILMVAQFIPIPIVQLVVRGINLVKSAYNIYQGVKHGSVAAVLGGVAGVAGGVGSFGAKFGASASFVNKANQISNGARALGAGYAAIAKGDFAAAGSLASNWFGGADTQTGRFFNTAGQVASTVNRARNGDVLGALSSGASAFGSFQGGDTRSSGAGGTEGESGGGTRSGVLKFIDDLKNNGTVQAVRENVSTIRGIVKAVRTGDYSAAAGSFLNQYGDALGIDSGTGQSIQRWAGVIEKVDGTRSALRNGNYPQAIGEAAGLLGIPLNELNQNRLTSAFGLRDAVADDRYPDAAKLAADLATSYGKPELANTFLSILAGLGIDQAPSQQQRTAA